MRHTSCSRFRGTPALITFLVTLLPLASLGSDEVVIRVNELEITQSEFQYSFRQAARSRFYHGTPPEGQIDAMREEVVENIINRILLVKEAERRAIAPDSQVVEAELDKIIANSAGHRADKEVLRQAIVDQKRAQMLERIVRQVEAPKPEAVEAYYRQHPEKFTEPERVRLSLILLNVDPSAPAATWDAAQFEAQGLLEEIENGGSFSELARLHSADRSADQGGDMGYLHKGMLNHTVQAAVDGLQPGDISEPLTVLEGIALFRLDERQPEALLPFQLVRERASGLLEEALAEDQWRDFLVKVKQQSDIEINKEILEQVALN